MNRWVEIAFDCLPMRSIARFDSPFDADDATIAKANRIKLAVETHGSHNTYYLHNAECVFHFTNDPSMGLVEFEFEGVICTCTKDLTSMAAHLDVNLKKEDCAWLNQQIVQWLKECVVQAVLVEFNRFIAAGDLQRTAQRIEELERKMDDQQGFVGMYL